MFRLFPAILLVIGLASPAAAEVELSFYLGAQSSPHSRVSGTHPDTSSPYSALIGWEAQPFKMPPYYGVRATWWRTGTFGWGAELTHAKVVAPVAERNAIGFDRMEFTDGHNLITLNAMRRWPGAWNGLTPYVGAGVGFAMPHVDVLSAGGARTFGYQLTGPAARVTAGVKWDLNGRYAIFTEYQFTWSQNEAELEGGGTMKTDIITNALNLGISLKF